jgi:uncharacterized protein
MHAHPANIYVPLGESDEEWFITNPVHKVTDILPGEVVDYLLTGKSPSPPESTLEELFQSGYVTEEPLSLPDVYKGLPHEASSHISVSIAVTYTCNLQCAYCFQRHGSTMNTGAVFDTDKVVLLSQAVEALKRKYLIFSPDHIHWELTGGEPLLLSNCSVVEQLLDLTGGKTKISITTNGTNIPEFVEVLSSRNVELRVTLDGIQSVHDRRRKKLSGHGTYSSIVKGIERAREAGIPVTVKVNVDRENVDELDQLSDQLSSLGWNEDRGVTLGLARVRATPTYIHAWTEAEFVEHMCPYLENHNLQNHFEVLFPGSRYFTDIIKGREPKVKMRRCRIDRTFFFSPDGMIFPCILLGTYPVGTFFPSFSLDQNKVAVMERRTITEMSKCLQCTYALICGGGCPADSIKHYNSISHCVCTDYPRILKTYIPYLLRSMQITTPGT